MNNLPCLPQQNKLFYLDFIHLISIIHLSLFTIHLSLSLVKWKGFFACPTVHAMFFLKPLPILPLLPGETSVYLHPAGPLLCLITDNKTWLRFLPTPCPLRRQDCCLRFQIHSMEEENTPINGWPRFRQVWTGLKLILSLVICMIYDLYNSMFLNFGLICWKKGIWVSHGQLSKFKEIL